MIKKNSELKKRHAHSLPHESNTPRPQRPARDAVDEEAGEVDEEEGEEEGGKRRKGPRKGWRQPPEVSPQEGGERRLRGGPLEGGW